MRVLVCGGRDYTDEDELFRTLDRLHAGRAFTVLIHGAARGADDFAGAWARSRGVQEVSVPAQWERYGRRAGPLRNEAMLALDPDLVVAFPGGRGTAHMVSIAEAKGIPVIQY